ncbi:helix-turn-helix domain-containing protein [Nonomuraea sp. NPDC059194]|uniref:helix-turn-helix domain-containing protein n=1 Tax=Nonomuraea sp. NPDC059194 TaxID=3346764 RepID=UPI0036B3EDDD
MPTLGALVRRSELCLRFVDGEDALRYGERPVEAVAEGAWAMDTAIAARNDSLRNVLLILPVADHAGSGEAQKAGKLIRWPDLEGVAGVILAGSAGCDGVPEELVVAARRYGVPLLTVPDDVPQAWARIFPVIRQEQQRELRQHADQLKAMQRLAMEPDGLRRLLRWLARQISGYAVLVDSTGTPLYSFPEAPVELLAQAGEDIQRVVTKRTRSAAVYLKSQVAHILSIGGEEPSAILVVAREAPFPSPLRSLVADAASLLWLRWRVEELGRHGRQVDLAEGHSREAALHLLMLGNIHGARRVTEALGSRLPDFTRVYIVECPAGLRDDYAGMCSDVTGGRAWIVRCPVYARHLIVLAPADSEEADAPLDQALRTLAASRPGCYVGAGQIVALRDTAAGYEQAFHALAVARGIPARCATFSSREDITALLGPGGRRWAMKALRPLLVYRPERRQDPDSEELRATLASWLAFYNGATKQLKIHRNTLSARLRHIERLLGCDLSDLRTQSELQLALRLLDQSPRHTMSEPDEVTLDVLLDTPETLHWAQAHLSSLRKGEPRLLETLRTWLSSNARLDMTASVLGLSVPATRKRLVRIEGVLARSLLNAPSARYDMVLAFRILDRRAMPPKQEIA